MPHIEKEVIVHNAQGLHARPAALFVQITSKYTSNVSIKKGNEKINGKSIMGILTLGAQKGTTIVLEIDGDDAQEMFTELEELLNKEEII